MWKSTDVICYCNCRLTEKRDEKQTVVLTLVPNNPGDGWQDVKAWDCEFAIYSRFVTRIIENIISFGSHPDLYGFLRCSIDSATFRPLSTVDIGEFRWESITGSVAQNKFLFYWKVSGTNYPWHSGEEPLLNRVCMQSG